jgi:hypothetical protein
MREPAVYTGIRTRFKTRFRDPASDTEIAALPSVARNDGVG